MEIPEWYTPAPPITVIGPGEVVQYTQELKANIIYSNEHTSWGHLTFYASNPSLNLTIKTIYQNKKSFTGKLICPQDAHPTPNEVVATMTEEAKGIVWYQRLNHENCCKVNDIHKHTKGIPHLKTPYNFQGYPIYMESKPHKYPLVKDQSRWMPNMLVPGSVPTGASLSIN